MAVPHTVTPTGSLSHGVGVPSMASPADLRPLTVPRDSEVVLSINGGAQQPFVFRTMGFMAVRAGQHIVEAMIRVRGYGCANHASIVQVPVLFICPINLMKVTTAFRAVNVIPAMALGCTEILKVWYIASVRGCIVRGLVVGAAYIVRRLILIRVVQHPFVVTGRSVLISPEIAGDARAGIVYGPSDCRLNPSQSTKGNGVILLGEMLIVAYKTCIRVTGKPDVSANGVI